MHLVPAARAGRRVIDGERVCEAISRLDRADVPGWAPLFGLLGDRNRLALLLCMEQSGPISVSDLAVAADMNDTSVSQALRLLRAAGAVTALRDGRIVRYQIADRRISSLLAHVSRVEGLPKAAGK